MKKAEATTIYCHLGYAVHGLGLSIFGRLDRFPR